MSAIDKLFQQLRADGRKAFMPFVTAGDPDLDFTAEVIRTLAARGASMCELGIPYSDPIADGPVIQASYTRALDRGARLDQILRMVGSLSTDVTAPIVTMVSYSIVYRHGLEAYVADAKRAGVAGAIVPDLPHDEAGPLADIAQREDFSLIQLVTPTTPRDRAVQIAEQTTGFIYYVSVTGITGERTSLPAELVDNVSWLREHTELPICIGFGISRPEHVRALRDVADGLIVGSALVRRIAQAAEKSRDEVLAEIGAYVGELVEAL
ncbi:MAG: tryptophan synthase subunit alpha [Pirellulales bacterium]|nr:tryptophan synthase subunit alpha [Pirellulales bacterium]